MKNTIIQRFKIGDTCVLGARLRHMSGLTGKILKVYQPNEWRDLSTNGLDEYQCYYDIELDEYCEIIQGTKIGRADDELV